MDVQIKLSVNGANVFNVKGNNVIKLYRRLGRLIDLKYGGGDRGVGARVISR
jgi:hypothetical protein